MSKNKQSSIQWIVGKLGDLESMFNLGIIDNIQYYEEKTKLLEQAKAMHKEEIITTWHKGYDNLSPIIDEDNCGDKYYKKTFGCNNGETMDN